MKYPSRNRKPKELHYICCPYCGYKIKLEDETEEDYEVYCNTKINYCRKCGALLVEAGGSFSEISEMNINDRYKLAYELSNGRVSDK